MEAATLQHYEAPSLGEVAPGIWGSSNPMEGGRLPNPTGGRRSTWPSAHRRMYKKPPNG